MGPQRQREKEGGRGKLKERKTRGQVGREMRNGWNAVRGRETWRWTVMPEEQRAQDSEREVDGVQLGSLSQPKVSSVTVVATYDRTA